jgi:hypothetical protein
MHLFGDPNFPRRNLTGSAILLAISSSQIGSGLERSDAGAVDYVFLVLWVVLLFAGIKMFRVGLASVPPDPKNMRLNQH